jgi:hypothetical protein
MAGSGQREPRPLWVRIVINAESTRRFAIAGVGMFVLLAVLNFYGVSIAIGSDSLFARIGVPLGIAACCLATAAAITKWFAIRWVDQKRAWPDR